MGSNIARDQEAMGETPHHLVPKVVALEKVVELIYLYWRWKIYLTETAGLRHLRDW